MSATAFTRATDIQTYTTPGTATWTKPIGAKLVKVFLIGGGGGGGAGRKGDGTSTSTRNGGHGGGGGGKNVVCIPASLVDGSVTVTVGAGGSGASAQSSNTSDGAAGSDGAASTFGSLACAHGGTRGKGGAATDGVAATGLTLNVSLSYNDNGASADTITRTTGSFVQDGHVAGNIIVVTGTASNNGVFAISSAAAQTLTLTSTTGLTSETVTSSIFAASKGGISTLPGGDGGYCTGSAGGTAGGTAKGGGGGGGAGGAFFRTTGVGYHGGGAGGISGLSENSPGLTGGTAGAVSGGDGGNGTSTTTNYPLGGSGGGGGGPGVAGLTSAVSLTYHDNGASADTITRASGTFIQDGHVPGDVITISGTASNNKTVTIATVAALTITLVPEDVLANETVSSTLNGVANPGNGGNGGLYGGGGGGGGGGTNNVSNGGAGGNGGDGIVIVISYL